MRVTFIASSLFVGTILVSNVVHSTLLTGLLLGGGLHHLHHSIHHSLDGHGIFEEFFSSIRNVFGGKHGGFHHYLDGLRNGVHPLLENSFGTGKLDKLFGPLSQIPDDADLQSLLGEKLQPKVNTFALLIQLAKKYCLSGKCDKSQIVAKTGNEDFRKSLENFLSGFDDHLEDKLDGFHSAFEELISSFSPHKKTELFKCLSKLPDTFDPSLILGEDDSSHSEQGIFSRQDILSLLIKFAKLQCTKGC